MSVNKQDEKNKSQSKQYSDKRSHAKQSSITKNDRVLVKQMKKNKLTPAFNPIPYYRNRKERRFGYRLQPNNTTHNYKERITLQTNTTSSTTASNQT